MVAERVAAARKIQSDRGHLNRDLERAALDELPMTDEATQLLAAAVERSALTARGYDRIRRVARTLADLEGAAAVDDGHVAEALALRGSW